MTNKNESVISGATKNNWKRLGINSSEQEKKLTSGANKRCSVKKIIPFEYFKNKKNVNLVNSLLSYIDENGLKIPEVVYNLALNILNTNGLITISNNKVFSKNKHILSILQDYNKSFQLDNRLLFETLPDNEPDILGIIYQSLMKEGEKNRKGSYYTPECIINLFCENLSKDSIYLDPCCGTGSFLLSAADKITNPQNIYGIDVDYNACFIAKINLIVKFKNIEFLPNIYNTDFLKQDSEVKFDFIGTNPPWGAMLENDYSLIYPEVLSNESFSYFIVQAERFLKQDGRCFFVLPESILNVGIHRDIRKFILEKFYINEINLAGKLFSGVLTDIAVISMSKNKITNKIEIIDKNETRIAEQELFESNKNYNFTTFGQKDAEILERIYSVPHNTLEKSIWGLGIVTGNNSKNIIEETNGAEKIFTGRDISPYFIKDTDRYIIYDRTKFQQTAPDSIYRAKEKLVYKFISKKPVFAYDNKQRLFLNSANILIPKVETHSIKTVLAFLNSTLFDYIYKKKFNELKILKGNLCELPFPVLDKGTREILEENVENYLKSQDKTCLIRLDEIIFDIYNINDYVPSICQAI